LLDLLYLLVEQFLSLTVHSLATSHPFFWLSVGFIRKMKSPIKQNKSTNRPINSCFLTSTDFAESIDCLATLYMQIGKSESIEELYRKACRTLSEQDENYTHCLSGLANFYAKQGETAVAEDCYWTACTAYGVYDKLSTRYEDCLEVFG